MTQRALPASQSFLVPNLQKLGLRGDPIVLGGRRNRAARVGGSRGSAAGQDEFYRKAHSFREGALITHPRPCHSSLGPATPSCGSPAVPPGAGAGPASSYSWIHWRSASRPQSRRAPGPSSFPPGLPRRAAIRTNTLAQGTGVRGPAGRPVRALLLLLLLSLPAGAWYKHVASPRYHTVGRAAGLLMGLRRSPYMHRRALRPAAGALESDTQGLGASPEWPAAGDTLPPAPDPRAALLLPSEVRKLLGPGRRRSRAGLRVSAPWSWRAPAPAPELEAGLGAGSRTSAEQARAFRESPVQPRSAQRTAFPGPHLSPGPERSPCWQRPFS